MFTWLRSALRQWANIIGYFFSKSKIFSKFIARTMNNNSKAQVLLDSIKAKLRNKKVEIIMVFKQNGREEREGVGRWLRWW